MKKVIIVSIAGLLTTISASAQKIDAALVPAAVKASFAKQFPGIAAKWEKEDGDFEAGFEKENKKMSAVFTPSGVWKETETSISPAELPSSVRQYIIKNYPAEHIKESAEIKKANGNINYEAEVKGKDLLFTAQGTFIK